MIDIWEELVRECLASRAHLDIKDSCINLDYDGQHYELRDYSEVSALGALAWLKAQQSNWHYRRQEDRPMEQSVLEQLRKETGE